MTNPSSMKPLKPRAIIVGGGPVGLTAALGLVRANIAFILLESRKDVVSPEGSDMTLQPMTMHALDQLNLLKPLQDVLTPVSRIERIDHNGREIGVLRFFDAIHAK
jgi:2-polyprenyl-6-methoxyphenol hydroxylase-like FAD-dependent oxidoreductase